jgi:hypothetical protein
VSRRAWRRLAPGAGVTVALALGISASTGFDAVAAYLKSPAISVAPPAVALKTPTALPVPLAAPPVPVKVPPVPIAAPPVPVKVPPVPIAAPPVPVKVPPVPVKVPPVPVKQPPPVPVKQPPLPTKPPPVPGKAPTVPVKAPPAPGKAPSVPAPRPAPSMIRPASGGAPPAPSGRVTSATAPTRSGALPVVPGSRGPAGRPLLHAVVGSALGSVANDHPAAGGGLFLAAAGQIRSAAFNGYAVTTELPDITQLLTEGHGALPNARVRALVLSLHGCLASLPSRLRSVLQLRTGVGEAHPLSARAVALRLGIPVDQVTALDLRALRRLRAAAETTGCAGIAHSETSFVFASYIAGSESGMGSAVGGVAGARYAQAPGEPGAQSVSPPAGTSTLPGFSAVRPGSSVFWTLSALVLAVLVIGSIALDNLGIGPRHRRRTGSGRRR